MKTKLNKLQASRFFVALLVFPFVAYPNCCGQESGQAVDARPIRKPFPSDWQVVTGDWRINKNSLVVDALKADSFVVVGEADWQNYEVQAKVTFRKVRNPSRWLAILVRAAPDGSRPWSQVPVRFDTTAANGMEFAVRTPKNSWSVRSKSSAATKSKLNVSRHLKVVVQGSHVDGYLDGVPVVSSDFCTDRPTGCVGLGASGCIAEFSDFSVRHLPAAPERLSPKGVCEVVAHRGFSGIAPENTLAAIRLAIKAGATGCEFDVYGCKDGNVVLMHDKTVDRTTNGKGAVTELGLQTLQSLDAGSWKHPKYSSEKVPTLVQALQLLKGSKCQPVIEIKMEGISKQVVEDVRRLGMADEVAVIAFSHNAIREIRHLEPRIKCAWLHGKKPNGTPAQQADWIKAQASSCNTNIVDLNYKILSPELVKQLKQRGLGVWTWTVNEKRVMQTLKKWGIDSITTDYPDRLR